MTYEQYLALNENILTDPDPAPPYNNPVYLNYARLGLSRMKRWDKTMRFSDAFLHALGSVNYKQHWILITEPWCGDAHPVVPAIAMLPSVNPLISYDLQLRDSEPFLINSYLTNGGKSIPKLIVRDADGRDLFTWGPKPEGARLLTLGMKEAGVHYDTIATELQNWYNKDKGMSFQQEIISLMTHHDPIGMVM